MNELLDDMTVLDTARRTPDARELRERMTMKHHHPSSQEETVFDLSSLVSTLCFNSF